MVIILIVIANGARTVYMVRAGESEFISKGLIGGGVCPEYDST